MTKKNAVRPAGAATNNPANGSTGYTMSGPASPSRDVRAASAGGNQGTGNSPSPAWARYIDSRLKQFVSR